ncbi:MAG: zinc-ribbon domain-containing protein [Chloroflexi bacterium]|nr:zinc-ribbon domain-containing protein [Chloroflexota bacterium]
MSFCSKCGKENLAESRFCRFCGAALSQGNDTALQNKAPFPSTEKSLSISPAIIALQAILVFGICALISFLLGSILGWPARAINDILPDHTCAGVQTRSWDMYSCSLEAGLLAMAGPAILMVIIFLLRKPLTRWIGRLIPMLPEMTRFLVLPIVATVIFTIVWAGFHEDTWSQTGILPQKIFPAVIGLFTYVVARFGPGIHHTWKSFFENRDKCPKWIRFVAVLAIPMMISVAATYQESVSQEALKEQFIVLIALVVSYILISPRIKAASTGESSSGKVGHLQTGGHATRNLALIMGGSALTGILFDQYLMDIALADCSSSELDCTQTAEMAGYNATTATGSGVIGAASVGLGTQIASTTASTAGGLAGATVLPDSGGGLTGATAVPVRDSVTVVRTTTNEQGDTTYHYSDGTTGIRHSDGSYDHYDPADGSITHLEPTESPPDPKERVRIDDPAHSEMADEIAEEIRRIDIAYEADPLDFVEHPDGSRIYPDGATYRFDSDGHITSIDNPDHTTDYYDSSGNKISTNNYDSNGHKISTDYYGADGQQRIQTIHYDLEGNEARVDYYDGDDSGSDNPE